MVFFKLKMFYSNENKRLFNEGSVMRIFSVSDIHLKENPENKLSQSCLIGKSIDVAVIAGDIDRHDRIVSSLDAIIPSEIKYIIFTTGNHDYMDEDISIDEANEIIRTQVDEWNRRQPYRKMIFLHEKVPFVDIQEKGDLSKVYRFVGGTLWGDDREFFNDPSQLEFARIKEFTPAVALAEYHKTANWIENALKTAAEEKRKFPFVARTEIVVTHHLPTRRVQPLLYLPENPKGPFSGELLRLTDKYKPLLWIYGHSHGGIDTKIGETTFLNSPLTAFKNNRVKNPYIITIKDRKISSIEMLMDV